MQRLLIATGNRHKTREFREMLGFRYEVSDLNDLAHIPAAEETGETFEANAVLKAVAASLHVEGLVVADDSGLEVDALGGAPGVRSARYAGEPSDDARNRRRLLAELENSRVRGGARSARFRCVLALAERGSLVATFSGTVEGVVIDEERGGGGFGYDPLFLPDGYDRTFAELPPAVKHGCSHRGRALEKLRAFLGVEG